MDLSHCALIVVDLQNDFCPPDGALALPGGRDIAPLINRLLTLPWRLRVATQDWHPRGHVSFASTHVAQGKKVGDVVEVQHPQNPQQIGHVKLFPDHCIQNTTGAELIRELDLSKFDHVVQKGQDKRVEQFSGFRDTTFAPSLVRSNLLDLLLANDVDSVYITGLAGDVCVKATAEHAADHGLQTTVLADGIRCVRQTEAALTLYWEQLQSRAIRFHTALAAGLLD